ncbi:MAG: 3'(2'),5'-bisphosphate nucleotidase CysQ [Ignavibacteriae bacterium]|nr:3'(2'),5'-bisphosphate nucleotidase CysQ [Ignavibacteriota bacterium]
MINEIIKISIDAGKKIMEIYESADFGVEIKADNSPLTLADKAAHEVIVKGLQEKFPDVPILSEEGSEIPYSERKNWDKFWLVDPLDGTKEFIKKNGEFTVNIALIENNKSVLGVIYAPAYDDRKEYVILSSLPASGVGVEESDNQISSIENPESFPGTLYFGETGQGAFKQYSSSEPISIATKPQEKNLTAVKSRSHSSANEQKILDEFGVTDLISVGSSLKFCMVAEGKAQVYYRHGPTNEWDVGAGHAIAEAAGATIEGLHYNKEIILNSGFLIKT